MDSHFIHKNPDVFVLDDVLNDEQCKSLINIAKHNLQDSRIVKGLGTTGLSVDNSRTSKSYHLTLSEAPPWHAIASKLTGFPVENMELPQVARYKKGNYYKPHFDSVDPNTDDGKEFVKRGQRIATVLFYLTTATSGGETKFQNLGISVPPRKGRCLIFYPGLKDGGVDTRLLHSAEPAVDKKWVCQIWIRDKRQPY